MTKSKNNSVEKNIPVSIGRQPVFDGKRRLWGYALLCVGNAQAPLGGLAEEDNVALSVAKSAYIGLQQIAERGKKVIVNFSEKNILDNLPYALPAALTVVQVSEKTFQRPSVPEILNRLKSDGYLIAVSEFSGNPDYEPLYRMADVICVDVFEKSKEALAAAVAETQPYPASLIAMQVQDPAQVDLCRELGFGLFHGPFFKLPDTITVRSLASSEVTRLNLLRVLEQDEVDFDQMAESIQADAGISFRLLAYLNSAAFGLRQKIKSIHQAIKMLGWHKMKNWLRVVLLSDMSQSKEASELVMLAAQRGKFLEQVASAHEFWGFDSETLHLLGMFSLLDAMLGIPMPEVVAYLPIDDKLKAALCGEPNNEYLPLLQLAKCIEEARWDDSESLIRQLNLETDKVKAAFQTAVDWAGEMASLASAAADQK
jgi:EAL and modified HD-GYP domain-containing signal transduction protein